MSRISPKSTIWSLNALFLTALLTTGCTTVGGQSSLGLVDASQAGLDTAERPTPTCTVVLQPNRGTPKVVEMPLDEGATVQTALEHTKATRKFRRMDIHVLRPAQARANAPAEPQKMNVEFDRIRREVEIDHDYALFPNDRVVIEEDPSTMIDDMFHSVAGRLGVPMVNQLVK
jgi:hypothetical protein